MSGKKLFNKVLYFLGIEDDDDADTPEKEEEYDSYIFKPEVKPKGRVINIHQTAKNKMVIFKPKTYDEVKDICDEVKNRRASIVNMEKLDKDTAKRVLDFMSGSIYALNGTVKKVGAGIFIFAPDYVDLSGFDMEEGVKEKPFSISK
ncbi:MAG: cell division protein SepF [Thermoanaerobacterales bacterium]|nr:cell division protein SepF [Thermoanaerobacterales bacterium]